ncbi:hypothetical protein DV096_13575 [Bradymonadaceae bacterium TMQ3]|uniref:Outer membrane protein beta-barrel domain-containing protein n=1 Tax=Lujinxingia sediminis TaxID=2480984 RepID=A0ABY0CTX9_9DELT|nr:hypothetical protein [Lujinxingia sediminis]RDV37532.1 hypothetical protein DV096_13575 [Bradymonadaceae bacterium TMQ3]RVU45779.1 hypothetical protein EA187_08425 [Lujinxingia sediminis]TXC75088.1 hypothetical protein FRC91_13465 [Bradymonadales bacterium TMQ1]
MKRWMGLFVAVLLTVSLFGQQEAWAQRNTGFGVGVGSATVASGISLKMPAGPTAFQLTAGCWGGCDGVAAAVDFLIGMPQIASADVVTLAWNFGGGGAVGLGGGSLGVAAAFVAGLEFHFQPLPIELVLEWRPGLYVVPDVDVELVNFGGHARWYF